MKNQSRVQSPESRAGGSHPVAPSSTLDPRPSTAGLCCSSIVNRKSQIVNGFTLVEVLTTMVLLSLIVLALMTIFNSTQKAFRNSLTQTDILESGRMAMGLITSDLGGMTPADSYAVNFYSAVTNFGGYSPAVSPVSPLLQGLTASSQLRTNVVEEFFSLSRQNLNGTPSWVGTGYLVASNTPEGTLYPLYRFYTNMSVAAANPVALYDAFIQNPFTNSAYWSHLVDGVVNLKVRAYSANGCWITNNQIVNNTFVTNAAFTNWVLVRPPYAFPAGEPSVVYMSSNVVPASVEVELGVLEDAVLQRAEGMSGAAQMNYLSNHVGQVHLFRQRVLVRNLDPSAYQ